MFGGGGGNLDPRKLQQMMEQMGVDMEDIDATEVVIRTDDEDLVFDGPEVQKMVAQGQETYQIVGSPSVEESSGESGGSEADDGPDPDDVALVAQRAGVSEDDARDALEAEDGDLAGAVARLD
ncbi:nascent polypeptide-associated complex protein [Halococcoides cellulosivorans]|uniref:Nascent polypeptide-associated complex protein n=1 Tax=Halococcoides cellulosivorans TaxID=1679096 RepID=A0A2R4X091_9EURY|nr:nascent polypeptide-associated complex protein [Halococcoides cellulosivorans]AWB27193.1 nascent polypeptide-associated complex protein [Halococcoides cellulosivorans]